MRKFLSDFFRLVMATYAICCLVSLTSTAFSIVQAGFNPSSSYVLHTLLTYYTHLIYPAIGVVIAGKAALNNDEDGFAITMVKLLGLMFVARIIGLLFSEQTHQNNSPFWSDVLLPLYMSVPGRSFYNEHNGFSFIDMVFALGIVSLTLVCLVRAAKNESSRSHDYSHDLDFPSGWFIVAFAGIGLINLCIEGVALYRTEEQLSLNSLGASTLQTIFPGLLTLAGCLALAVMYGLMYKTSGNKKPNVNPVLRRYALYMSFAIELLILSRVDMPALFLQLKESFPSWQKLMNTLETWWRCGMRMTLSGEPKNLRLQHIFLYFLCAPTFYGVLYQWACFTTRQSHLSKFVLRLILLTVYLLIASVLFLGASQALASIISRIVMWAIYSPAVKTVFVVIGCLIIVGIAISVFPDSLRQVFSQSSTYTDHSSKDETDADRPGAFDGLIEMWKQQEEWEEEQKEAAAEARDNQLWDIERKLRNGEYVSESDRVTLFDAIGDGARTHTDYGPDWYDAHLRAGDDGYNESNDPE